MKSLYIEPEIEVMSWENYNFISIPISLSQKAPLPEAQSFTPAPMSNELYWEEEINEEEVSY